MQPSQQHVDALTLASWGFAIGPLNGKAPRVKGGYAAFTNDRRQINRWWRRWRTANIGCRPPVGVVVLDLDPRNGSDDTWAALNDGHEVPDTLTTATGSGGEHLWYRLPYAGNLRGIAGAGIDIQHAGKGQVVMPGSIHPDTGRHYRFSNWVCPDRLPVLPEHLRRHVYRPAPVPRAVRPAALENRRYQRWIDEVANSSNTGRNIALNKYAWIARQVGVDLDHELADAARSTGLPEDEIQGILARKRVAEITHEFH